MRPPLAGKRDAARKLASDVRRLVEPVERLIGVRLPGASPGPPPAPTPEPAPDPAPAPAPDDALARIDAARDRLRATIEPPQDDAD